MQSDPFKPQAPSSLPDRHVPLLSQQPSQQAPPGVHPCLVVSQMSGPFCCGTQHPFGQVSGPQGGLSRQVPVSLLQYWYCEQSSQATPPRPHC
jgi:hypothetical protein